MCQGRFDGVSRKFTRSFKGVSRKIERYFKGVLRVFSRELKRSSMGVSFFLAFLDQEVTLSLIVFVFDNKICSKPEEFKWCFKKV